MPKSGGIRVRNMQIVAHAKEEFDLFLGLVTTTDAFCVLSHREKRAKTRKRR